MIDRVKRRSSKQVKTFVREKFRNFITSSLRKIFLRKFFPDEVFPDVFNQNWNYDVTFDLEPVTIFISRNAFIFRKQPKVFSCDICGITSTRCDNISRHMQRKHDVTYKDEKTSSARAICSYPNCNGEYLHKSKYIEHLSEEHYVDYQTIEKTLQICRCFFHGKKKNELKTFYTLVNSAVQAVAKLQAICIMFVNMIVTVKLSVEKKNLTVKRIKDIIMKELRETHFALLE